MNSVYAIIVLLALLVMGGFYVMFDRITALRSDFNNLELSFQLLTKDKSDKQQETNGKDQKETPPAQIPPTSQNQRSTNETKGITIPTAIIFEAQSSPLLQPQTKLIVTIESVAKAAEGNVVLNLKIFSNDANSYSAVEARDLFERIRLDADNEKPLKAEGQFNSIPPKSAVYGTVTFKIEFSENIFILQVGSGTNLKFYEFDFAKKTYKETVIG